MTNIQTTLLVLVAIFAILFGWFAIRPAQIRANCQRSAEAGSALVPSERNAFYMECLHRAGLE